MGKGHPDAQSHVCRDGRISRRQLIGNGSELPTDPEHLVATAFRKDQ